MKKLVFRWEYYPELFPAMCIRFWELDEKDVEDAIKRFKEGIRKKVELKKPIKAFCINCDKEIKARHFYRYKQKKVFLCEDCEKLIFGGEENV